MASAVDAMEARSAKDSFTAETQRHGERFLRLRSAVTLVQSGPVGLILGAALMQLDESGS